MIESLPTAENVHHFCQQRCKDSLGFTAKYLLGYTEITTRTHGPTIGALEAETKRKLIVLPRGCFKTSIAAVSYAIWLILRNPNIRILLDSAVRELSVATLRAIKSHFLSDEFRSLFPGWEFTLDNEDKKIVSTRTHHKKEPTITAGGIGARKTGQHYDVIIADDLNNEDNSLKKEIADKVIDHYRLYTSILDPGGTIVVIGTRYSELDLIGWILDNEINPKTGLIV